MVDDSLGKALMLTSTERMHEALDLLDRFPQLTYSDVRNMMTTGVWNKDEQRGMLELIDSERAKGNPPAQIPNLELELRQAISTSFHVADKMGGITGIGSMVFDRSRGMNDWDIYNPALLTMNYREGQFGRINGMPGMGKTNLACRMMEQWHSEGKVAISNIFPTSPDDRYVYAPSAKALLKAIVATPADVVWHFWLDEGGLVMDKKEAMTRRSRDLEHLFRIIRKLHGNLTFIEQREDSVPTLLFEWSTSLFFCHEPKVVTFDLRGPFKRAKGKVFGFPETKLPYQTYDPAYFKFNINVEKLFETLSGATDPKAAIQRFLVGETTTEDEAAQEIMA